WAMTGCTRPGAILDTTAATGPAWYPTTTTTRRTAAASNDFTALSTIGRPPRRTRALDPPPVTAWRRSDRPAARTTPTRALHDSSVSADRCPDRRSASGTAVTPAGGPVP